MLQESNIRGRFRKSRTIAGSFSAAVRTEDGAILEFDRLVGLAVDQGPLSAFEIDDAFEEFLEVRGYESEPDTVRLKHFREFLYLKGINPDQARPALEKAA